MCSRPEKRKIGQVWFFLQIISVAKLARFPLKLSTAKVIHGKAIFVMLLGSDRWCSMFFISIFKHWESAFVCIILAHSGEEFISRRPNKIFERNYPTILPDYQSKLILSLCFLSFSSFIQRFCLVIIWIAYLSQYCSSILWHIYLCPGGTVHERNPVRA